MRTLAFLIILTLTLPLSLAQTEVVWNRTYGGSQDDGARSMVEAADGGYVIAGYINSSRVGGAKAYVLKVDTQGNRIWERSLGGAKSDGAESIIRSKDGAYIVAGWSYSVDPNGDAYIFKIDDRGELIWERNYGGGNWDHAGSVVSVDGGYVVAGFTHSYGSGNRDAYLFKIDEAGNMLWNRTYGGGEDDSASSIVRDGGDGFVLCGYTSSLGAGSADAYILRVDRQGEKVWEKALGGSEFDKTSHVIRASDGTYIAVGYSYSLGPGKRGAYILRITDQGDSVWERSFGGNGSERAISVIEVDGGFIVVGETDSFGDGDKDVYVLGIDGDGNKIWEAHHGGDRNDAARCMLRGSDGGYIIGGDTESFESELLDVYLLKIAIEPMIPVPEFSPFSALLLVTTMGLLVKLLTRRTLRRREKP